LIAELKAEVARVIWLAFAAHANVLICRKWGLFAMVTAAQQKIIMMLQSDKQSADYQKKMAFCNQAANMRRSFP
jgi:hypothetical protein